MKRRAISIALLTMICISLFSISTPASAVGIASSDNFSSFGAAAIPGSSTGVINVSVTCKGNFTMAKIGVSKIIFQEKIGLFWNDAHTFTHYYKYNTVSYNNNFQYSNLVSGRKYRAVVTFYCEASNGDWSEVEVTTGEATAP